MRVVQTFADTHNQPRSSNTGQRMVLYRVQPPIGGLFMMPEDPDCPYPLKLLAIQELEAQIQRIVESIDWDIVKEQEKEGLA